MLRVATLRVCSCITAHVETPLKALKPVLRPILLCVLGNPAAVPNLMHICLIAGMPIRSRLRPFRALECVICAFEDVIRIAEPLEARLQFAPSCESTRTRLYNLSSPRLAVISSFKV